MAAIPGIPITLTGSVGRNGQNFGPDILAVQGLLAVAFAKNGGGTLFAPTELGQDTPKLGDAIKRFQEFQKLPLPDGKVDRDKNTWKKLLEVAAKPPGPPLPPTPAAGQLLARIPGAPSWEAWGSAPLPLLMGNKAPETDWELQFGGSASGVSMGSRAYVCDKSLGTPHVGVGFQEGVKPSAYLLYFHHSIGQEAAAYSSNEVRFRKGIGDYMIGRMKGLDQIAMSGKRVCLVVPEPTFAGQGVFDRKEDLVTRVLKEIDADLTGETRDLPPLLVASYSDGLGSLNNFMLNSPNLRKQVKGLYDFDGKLVVRFASISLGAWAKGGAKVFRYVGNSSPGMIKGEAPLAYVQRHISQTPKIIPLPKARWVNHPLFGKFKTDSAWANQWWLHFYIPSCMLSHGLANTDGI